MGEQRDDVIEPELMTGTTDEKLVKIGQRLGAIERRLKEMNENVNRTQKTVEEMKNEMENPSNLQPWDSLAISLMLTGAATVLVVKVLRLFCWSDNAKVFDV